jgi:glycogen(starch) synthase
MARRLKNTDEEQEVKMSFDTAFLFEIAWEVCNQVGGIYTVIRSKVPSVLKTWNNNNYCLLGPYIPHQVGAELEPITDLSDPIGKAVMQMRQLGYDVHYGSWLVSGQPRVVLFNPFHSFHMLGHMKFEFWEHHGISLGEDELLNKVVSFGFQVKEFLCVFAAQNPDCADRIIAHFHEWMAATPIPELRKIHSPIKTVFTTHATLLGRYLAMNDPCFYNNLPFYDWAKEAKYFDIESPANIERAAAHGAHLLTTVSEVTALECVQLLGRKPDKILPNGINIKRFEAVHEFQNLHFKYKEQINEFVMGHFFPSYSFDLSKTLYFFTSGRFEYHNKGFNLTLEALAKLNWRLKHENIDVTVVTFFITPQPHNQISPHVLNSRFLMEEVRDTCDEILKQLSKKMFVSIAAESKLNMPNLNSLVDQHLEFKLRRLMQTWKSSNLPPVVTHNMVLDDKDPILGFLRVSGLVNSPYDKVKVVYHPEFLSQTNPLFRMDYGQFVRGCNLGVFPSYYEPWGYTPLECLASGLPAVTSDLSGFGDYVINNIPEYEHNGIFVNHRKNKDFNQAAQELADTLFQFATLSLRERIAMRNRSEEISVMFDWEKLGKYYEDTYRIALTKK